MKCVNTWKNPKALFTDPQGFVQIIFVAVLGNGAARCRVVSYISGWAGLYAQTFTNPVSHHSPAWVKRCSLLFNFMDRPPSAAGGGLDGLI